MSTIGKRFVDRTHDRSTERIIDTRVKAVLSAVIAEPRGHALNAYMKAGLLATKQRGREQAPEKRAAD
jgi:hypothetical protein